MSELAVQARSRRHEWARPGSRHDRVIGLLRWALPSAIGVLAAFLVLEPIMTAGDVSFVLDKSKVEVAHERLKLQSARYRGQDAKGRPFTLDAGSAVQKSSAEPVVMLNDLAASLALPEGPATLRADQGRYDMDRQQLAVPGPIAFRAVDGYRLDTTNAVADLKSRRLESTGAVTGATPQGTFSADAMRADLEARTVRLQGNARLRIDPRKTR